MESNLTEETIAYAKKRYEKMFEKEGEKIDERNGLIRSEILETLTDTDEKVTAKTISEILNVSVQRASYHLYTLANEGLIVRHEGTPKEYSAIAD